MKKAFLFAFTLLFSVMCYSQSDWRIHPDDAKYKIYGRFETKFRNGKAFYELTEVNPIGFAFESIDPTYYGGKSKHGDVYFTFDHVTYKGNPDLDNIGLFVYNESTNKWDADSETESRQGSDNETKDMEVMLVLDCSTSLSDAAFVQAKNSAASFIDEMLRESSAGNIHIGIIGFSSWELTKVRPIESLTPSSSKYMKDFISGFTKGGGTALFRSYDEAFDMLNSYSNNIENNKFAVSAIVTFTDGLDNGSINESKEIGSKKNYFNYIKNNVLRKSIKGVPCQSYAIFLPGGADVKDKARENEAENDLRTLAKQVDNYFRVNNASQLEAKFKDIAKNLIDSWKIIQCYIAPGQNGRVCWTFGRKVNNTPIHIDVRPKKKHNFWLGIGIEGGLVGGSKADDYKSPSSSPSGYSPLGYYSSGYYSSSYSSGYSSGYTPSEDNGNENCAYFLARLDAAWSLSDMFAVGGTFGLGYGEGDETIVKVGPLAKLSFNEGSALLLGGGYLSAYDGALYLTAGWKFKSPWYINAGVNLGETTGFSIGVGYSLFGK